MRAGGPGELLVEPKLELKMDDESGNAQLQHSQEQLGSPSKTTVLMFKHSL